MKSQTKACVEGKGVGGGGGRVQICDSPDCRQVVSFPLIQIMLCSVHPTGYKIVNLGGLRYSISPLHWYGGVFFSLP